MNAFRFPLRNLLNPPNRQIATGKAFGYTAAVNMALTASGAMGRAK